MNKSKASIEKMMNDLGIAKMLSEDIVNHARKKLLAAKNNPPKPLLRRLYENRKNLNSAY